MGDYCLKRVSCRIVAQIKKKKISSPKFVIHKNKKQSAY